MTFSRWHGGRGGRLCWLCYSAAGFLGVFGGLGLRRLRRLRAGGVWCRGRRCRAASGFVFLQVVRQFVYTAFISNNRASFHLWRQKSLVKYQKVSKYYENDYLQNFVLLFMSLLRAPTVGGIHIWARNSGFHVKWRTMGKVSFLFSKSFLLVLTLGYHSMSFRHFPYIS